MNTFFTLFIALIVIIGPIALMSIIGKHYGEKLIHDGIITETQMLEQGYIGMFFIKIFGY